MKTRYDKMIQKIAETGYITERQIITLKAALNARRLKEFDLSDIRIMPEQTEKGLAWIEKNRNRKLLRDSFGFAEWSIFEDFKAFRFDGFSEELTHPQGIRTWYFPIYRVIAHNGDSFSYVYYVTCKGPQIDVLSWGSCAQHPRYRLWRGKKTNRP